jgi:hypothetical protein
MEIPPGGIVVRLMPVVDQQLPSSLPPPPLTSNLKKITLANPNYLEVDDGEFFNPVNETKIYDNSSKSSHKLWKTYLPGDGKMMPDSTKTLLLTKYVDVNERHGGRSSHKKYKKSSKRGRSMKRNVSKSRKYSRRK